MIFCSNYNLSEEILLNTFFNCQTNNYNCSLNTSLCLNDISLSVVVVVKADEEEALFIFMQNQD